ncbi:hypothetical protein [Roseateles terrae]|uniref:Uncharacterized protein n=1 Tax=Roseateles terrae TaxID=431060 RepID=A0ABR6GUH7_9BURK|nr:hypothetical protein [Roseateles terrae]MBB3195361.1 hypothetical protein [Roseateles terrae]
MNAALNSERLLSYLGLSSEMLEDKLLWSELNTLDRPRHPESGEISYYDWVLVRRKGLELGFVDSEYNAGAARFRWGHGHMTLAQLYLYSGHADVQRFHGAMPFGLRWEDGRTQARAHLSEFESSRHSHLTDAWDVPGYRLTVVYSDDGTSIVRVVCRRLPDPLDPTTAMPPPPLQDLLQALGESVANPSFASIWPLGSWSRQHTAEARDEGEVDLNPACGLTLKTESDGIDPVLRSVTFHRNRDQEGSGWRGELPAGLAFEDSPEQLFHKLNIAPLQQADTALTGYGVWDLPDFTLHVLYSNVDNRLIRVKVLAPGTWRSVRDE